MVVAPARAFIAKLRRLRLTLSPIPSCDFAFALRLGWFLLDLAGALAYQYGFISRIRLAPSEVELER
jgi:hypothetical protein